MQEQKSEQVDFEELMKVWQRSVDKMPDAVKGRVREALAKLQEMVLERRPPRIVVLGRRGAGKSSLINAIFGRRVAMIGPVVSMTGKSRWYSYRSPSGSLDILDNRGLADRIRPETAEFDAAADEIRHALREKVPDAILFLCKAKEVDAHIEADVTATLALQKDTERLHGYKPPILGLVTQVDEIDPKRVEPPYDHPRKREQIDLACKTLEEAFAAQGCDLEKVLPVSAYAEYEDGKCVYSNAWNIDVLVHYLIEVLPQSARLIMARTAHVKTVQRDLAQEVVKATTVVCSGIAAVPIPVADAVPLTAAQILMIVAIGFVSGRDLSKKTAGEFASAMGANVGAAFVFREIARGLAKLIPGAGSVISSAVAGAATWALGQAAILYFIDGASAEDAKLRMRRSRRQVEDGEVQLPADTSAAS
ncbi:MAG: GTPase [Acidobacteriota bacterium]|nr:GTPase [Acidobacteriota bacterium]